MVGKQWRPLWQKEYVVPVEVSGSKKSLDTLATLRRHITSGAWEVNSRIPKESELMALLGVGKSTIREAVRSLANLGMLETVRGVGTFVRSRTPAATLLSDYISEHSAEDVLTLRRGLEIEAARQAAKRRTAQQLAQLRASYERDREFDPDEPPTPERGQTPGPFHHLIFEAAGDGLLAALYSGVMRAIRAAIDDGLVTPGASHEARYQAHRALLDAIAAQDARWAAEVMAEHVDTDLVLHEAPSGDGGPVEAR